MYMSIQKNLATMSASISTTTPTTTPTITCTNVWIVYEKDLSPKGSPIIHGIFSSEDEAKMIMSENVEFIKNEYGDTHTQIAIASVSMDCNLLFNGEPVVLF